jgi:cysteine desulfurase
MLPYFTETYGNPSGIYSLSRNAKEAVDRARDTIAKSIGANKSEIYFTSGGTEADNWALKATVDAYEKKGKHIIVSKIEHHAILHSCKYLEKHGCEVTYLEVNEEGLIDLNELEAAIRQDTILISIMFANNEIGTIEPAKAIGKLAKKYGILFHTDAVQAFGHIPVDVDEMNIDMLSASGHKCNGPKGIGVLYIRKGIKIHSYLHGGSQERKRRAGTENVPAIVGFASAVKIAMETMDERINSEIEIRDYLIKQVMIKIPYARLNGPTKNRLSNNANFCFQFIEGESLLLRLDQIGICASSGSACTTGSLDPSHVLLAIGLPHEIAHGSLRLTLCEKNTKVEMDYVVENLSEIVMNLRRMSPLYDDFIKEEKII